MLPDGLLQILKLMNVGEWHAQPAWQVSQKRGSAALNSMVSLYKEKEALGLTKIDVFGSYLHRKDARQQHLGRL
jgi:hypothetical protein